MPSNSNGRNTDANSASNRLGEILAHVIRAEEAGESTDRDALLRQHPELAEELNEFFERRQRMKRLVEPLRDGAAHVLHVRCPHCHNPIELLERAPLTAISCPSCGSSFSLVDDLERWLDGQPIVARRTGTVERTAKWVRREPAAAALLGVSSLTMIVIVIGLMVSNVLISHEQSQTSAALELAQQEKENKEAALNAAEVNLAFAIEIFRNIVASLGARGAPAAQVFELPQYAVPNDTALSEADAQLLESLVEFFEEFAHKNQSDLRAESAEAYRSVGEIRRRLGQFDESGAAYNKALQIYERLAEGGPAVSNVIKQALINNEIGLVQRDQGDFSQAMRSHLKAIDLLKRQLSEIADARQCRFELVQTYLALASFWEPSGIISQHASTAADKDRPPTPLSRGDENRDDDRPDNRGDEQRERRPDGDRNNRKPPHELALEELQRLIAKLGQPFENADVHVEGLAMAPDGVLYASAVRHSNAGRQSCLYRINAKTGVATSIGKIVAAEIDGLDFGADGKLYGAISSGSKARAVGLRQIVSIDTATGKASSTATEITFGDVDALAISSTGRAFLTDGSNGLHSVNPIRKDDVSGVLTDIRFQRFLRSNDQMEGMCITSDEAIFGLCHETRTFLVRLEPETGRVTKLGDLGFAALCLAADKSVENTKNESDE